jgi:uncharacterized membrane protein YfcA
MLLAVGAVCVGVASVIGGATGFGTALVATPSMLLTGFDIPAVAVINLVAGLVTRVDVAFRLRDRIDWRRVALLGAGSVPGAWLGAATLHWLPEHLVETGGRRACRALRCGYGRAAVRPALRSVG